jgi:branched-chain amino acid transport system permease protein
VVGLVVGLPALRIRGVQLAVVTIAAALMLEEFYFKNASLTDLASGSGAPVPTP